MRSVVSNAIILEFKEALPYLVFHRWLFEGAPSGATPVCIIVSHKLWARDSGG